MAGTPKGYKNYSKTRRQVASAKGRANANKPKPLKRTK